MGAAAQREARPQAKSEARGREASVLLSGAKPVHGNDWAGHTWYAMERALPWPSRASPDAQTEVRVGDEQGRHPGGQGGLVSGAPHPADTAQRRTLGTYGVLRLAPANLVPSPFAAGRYLRLAPQSAPIEPFEHSFLANDEKTCWNRKVLPSPARRSRRKDRPGQPILSTEPWPRSGDSFHGALRGRRDF